MNDSQILAQFEAAQLDSFTHRDHIRVAWLYLRQDGWDTGYRNIRRGLLNFATALGVTDKYHETLTRFWAHVIQHCIDEQPNIDDFEAFIAIYPMLLDKSLVEQHYSPELLWSDVARRSWHEPDLAPMPQLA